MNHKTPRVSIGLPVYNGENYIREAIESILNQTFEDFELIISDNASTDNSPKICQEYAAKDQRIRYYRNKTNIGGVANINRTITLSRGEFFKFAAHDDLCAPEFLEKCVAVLDRQPEVVLCCPKAQLIDQDGQPYKLSPYDLDPLFVTLMEANITVKTDAAKPSERLFELLRYHHYWYPISGLIRMNVLKKTPLLSTYAGGDKILLARLVLFGKFHELPEKLLFLRRHVKQSLNIGARSPYLYNIWFKTSNKGKLILPFWMRFFEHLDAINQAPLNFSERIICYQTILGLLSYEWKNLVKELLVAILLIFDYLYRLLPGLQHTSEEELLFGKIPRLTRL